MRYEKLKLIALILLGLRLTGLQAQNTVPATGGNASGNGGTVSFSVGQVVYTTNTGTNGSVTQGVQQPFEISMVTGLEEAKGVDLMVSAYPIPTTEYVKLKVDASTSISIQSMSYQLFDINGKLLETKKITDIETSINMLNLPKATYFIIVFKNNIEVKTFKIIKN